MDPKVPWQTAISQKMEEEERFETRAKIAELATVISAMTIAVLAITLL
jgi:hypothetical protein